MKISDINSISLFQQKLRDFPLNESNKNDVKIFINQLKSIISVDFTSNNYLTNKLSEIIFTPKSYFPEMKNIEQTKSWNLGIKKLDEFISEIINEGRKVLDLTDIATLENVISSGIETNYIEFKSTLRWDIKLLKVNEDLEKVVLKTICALHNSEGGNLFIGVEDSGNILGLANDYKTFENGLGDRDKFELHLRNLLNHNYGKSYVVTNIKILFPLLKNIEVCQVNVKRGDKPLFLKVGNSKGQDVKERFYIRSGNQSIELEKLPELVNYAIEHFS